MTIQEAVNELELNDIFLDATVRIYDPHCERNEYPMTTIDTLSDTISLVSGEQLLGLLKRMNHLAPFAIGGEEVRRIDFIPDVIILNL